MKSKAGIVLLLSTCLIVFVAIGGVALKSGDKRLKTVVANFMLSELMPDSAKIELADDWYFLNHIASPLIQFNHIENRFEPLLAESWKIDGATYEFRLKNNARFHDGTEITARDVEASILRLMILRTSTHFPVWQFFDGCSQLKVLSDSCSGIEIVDQKTIRFRMNHRFESFFLLMASPEGSIWRRADIDQKSLRLNPKAFSGPYFIDSTSSNTANLSRNPHSPITRMFPMGPEKILVRTSDGPEFRKAIESGGIDVFTDTVNPMSGIDYSKYGYERFYTSPSAIFYLFKIGKSRSQIGRDAIEALWRTPLDPEISPAETFLPFGSLGAINREQYLQALPSKSTVNPLRVAVPPRYSKGRFVQAIAERIGAESGLKIDMISVSFEEWIKLLGSNEDSDEFDYLFSDYLASERYPSVQLRYLLKQIEAPFDLSDLDQLDPSDDKIAKLRLLQLEMLSRQTVIPLFFARNMVVYKRGLEIGRQPVNDADIQLWRLGETR